MIRITTAAAAFALIGASALAQTAVPPATPAPPATAPAATPAPAEAAPATGAALPGGITPQQAQEAARNQLGVLKYCQAKGWAGEEVVATQNKMIGMLPAATDATATQTAEAKGVSGSISAMGTEITLADAATQQSTTEEALCKQLETFVTQMSAAMPPA